VPLISTLKRESSGTTSGLAMRCRKETLRGDRKEMLINQPGLKFETRDQAGIGESSRPVRLVGMRGLLLKALAEAREVIRRKAVTANLLAHRPPFEVCDTSLHLTAESIR
jgi:hypothetical protein